MSSALIVIDMLNPYRHDDAGALTTSVREIISPLSELISGAREAGMLTVYVNDNHGDWTAGRPELVERALDGAAPELVEPVVPSEGVPFLVKARHSIFYETLLEYVLHQEGMDQLILSGQVTEQCILYSALDGYVRHFDVIVPSNAVAHIHSDLAETALRMMEINMHAHVTSGAEQALQAATRSR